MIQSSGPRLNLYNFFSVLLPGVTFVLGIFPFFPSGVELNVILGIIPLLAGGFVFGQAIHSLAVVWQSRTPRRTHREQFQELLLGEAISKYKDIDETEDSQQIIGERLLREFYDSCDRKFDGIELKKFQERNENSEKELEDLYTLIRGVVHFDGRGRSRTFQAIYAFCRSMWVLSIILWAVYYVYALTRFWSVPSIIAEQPAVSTNTAFLYTPIVSEYVPSPAVVFILSTILFLSSHKMFRSATDEYKEYFTEYLISDFLLIEHEGKTPNRNDNA